MIVPLLTLLAVATDLLLPKLDHALSTERGALWRVVQACVVNHRITGSAFPCLEVNDAKGIVTGFVVLRPPLEQTHIVIVPTVRIVGIEDASLQSASAPNFFEDAWEARKYVLDRAPRRVRGDEIGLAVNSKAGRTQDQLHIHVDCVNMDVRRALKSWGAKIPFNVWSPFRLDPAAPRYLLLKLKRDDLAGINVFKLAADGLAVQPHNLGGMIIAVIGASFPDGKNGFYILAALTGSSDGKSEALLDHSCSAED
jgi:CDP-diacylglycerol pyrophosphatase